MHSLTSQMYKYYYCILIIYFVSRNIVIMPFKDLFSAIASEIGAEGARDQANTFSQDQATGIKWDEGDDAARRRRSDSRDHSAVVARSSKTIQVRSQAIGDTRVTRIKVSIRQYGSEHSSFWQLAVPAQGWYRALLVLFHIIMGSVAIQVGLREENVVCEASFSTLMIIAGLLQLVQASLGMYMVVYAIGSEGEELRLCLWMIELVAWTLVSHALLTDICGNRKIHATSILYLFSSLIVWIITLILWLNAYYRTEDDGKRVEIKYIG